VSESQTDDVSVVESSHVSETLIKLHEDVDELCEECPLHLQRERERERERERLCPRPRPW
jgi:hypothetical protein